MTLSVKYIILTGIIFFNCNPLFCQTLNESYSTNRTIGSMEKNMLFYANNRYLVSQSGSAMLNLPVLFDGQFVPSTVSNSINSDNPLIILIDGLPEKSAQVGAWIGWSTRYYFPKRFKIEVFDTYNGASEWKVLADVNNYNEGHYLVKIPWAGTTTAKIRFTFFETNDTQNRLGLSELFYFHPEAAKAYDGLVVQYNASGNVGIGTTASNDRLSVNGNIRAKEIKVESSNWPDYVFNSEFNLMTIEELEKFITHNKHLPEIPNAKMIEKDGHNVGEINKLLLKKIEELTLYILQFDKRIKSLEGKSN